MSAHEGFLFHCARGDEKELSLYAAGTMNTDHMNGWKGRHQGSLRRSIAEKHKSTIRASAQMATRKSLCRTANDDRGKTRCAAESGYRLPGREEASARDRAAESSLNRVTDSAVHISSSRSLSEWTNSVSNRYRDSIPFISGEFTFNLVDGRQSEENSSTSADQMSLAGYTFRGSASPHLKFLCPRFCGVGQFFAEMLTQRSARMQPTDQEDHFPTLA